MTPTLVAYIFMRFLSVTTGVLCKIVQRNLMAAECWFTCGT
jgi:hypothetical protein